MIFENCVVYCSSSSRVIDEQEWAWTWMYVDSGGPGRLMSRPTAATCVAYSAHPLVIRRTALRGVIEGVGGKRYLQAQQTRGAQNSLAKIFYD